MASKLELPPILGLYRDAYVQKYYNGLGVQADSFHFAKVSEEKEKRMLAELNTTKATGLDNIPARFLSDAAEHISPCLSRIINISLEQGRFPKDRKHAKIIPLYKKGSRSDPVNYGPVSILSVTSKILEKVAHICFRNI